MTYRSGWLVTDLICARMSTWLRSNMSSTSTTPSEVVYKATLPPSPETMYRSPLTRSVLSGPGGLAVCVYTDHDACTTNTTAQTPRTTARLMAHSPGIACESTRFRPGWISV